MTRRAVVVAGGKGTRLGTVAEEIPKSLVPINGIPILDHQIHMLRRQGIERIDLLTGHLAGLIEEHLGDGSHLGLDIRHFKEASPLGTAGGLHGIVGDLDSDFLVLYGDIMLDMDLRALWEFHRDRSGIATLVVHPNDHPHDSDLVEIDRSDRILRFHSRPHPQGSYFRNLVSAAVYVLSPRIIHYIPEGTPSDFGHDIFPGMVERERLIGYPTAEYIKDVGTPMRLRQVEADLRSGKIARLNRRSPRKAVFLDRDGTLCRKVDQLHRIEDIELLPGAAEAVARINRSGFLAILVTNQPAVARNLCTIDDVQEMHGKLEFLLAQEGAMLDAVYFCPHHPDAGYPEENPTYKVPCQCRKPGIGMLLEAQRRYNILLAGSFMVGDSSRDVACGRNARLATVGVRTGDGFASGDEPDHLFNDILEFTRSSVFTDATRGDDVEQGPVK